MVETAGTEYIQGFGWALLLVLQLPAIALMIRRSSLAPLPERRRVRLFLCSLIAGTLPLALAITAEQLIPSFRAYVRTPGNRTPFNVAVYVSMGLTPLIIAYSVLVQRILDVRLIVQRPSNMRWPATHWRPFHCFPWEYLRSSFISAVSSRSTNCCEAQRHWSDWYGRGGSRDNKKHGRKFSTSSIVDSSASSTTHDSSSRELSGRSGRREAWKRWEIS